MSFDIWMEADLGGPEPVWITDSRSPTYNIAPMFSAAIDGGIRSLDGTAGADAIETLRDAIRAMEDDPGKFDAMAPANGWGDREGALSTLRWMLDASLTAPRAIWRVT